MESTVSFPNIWYNSDLLYVSLDREIKWQGYKSKITSVAFKAM